MFWKMGLSVVSPLEWPEGGQPSEKGKEGLAGHRGEVERVVVVRRWLLDGCQKPLQSEYQEGAGRTSLCFSHRVFPVVGIIDVVAWFVSISAQPNLLNLGCRGVCEHPTSGDHLCPERRSW